MLDFNPKNRRNFRDPQIAQFDWLKSQSIVLIGGSHSKILFFLLFPPDRYRLPEISPY